MKLHGRKSKGILRVGTSGIVVPGNKLSFPPEFQDKSRLSYYASLFSTLEVNSTFRKIPLNSTLERWSAEVPGEFQFTLKIWQEISHVKQLNFTPANLDLFLKAANHIHTKKGCLLLQFPGSIKVESLKQVEKILKRIKQLDPNHQWRLAVEFRNESWYNDKVYTLLNKYEAVIVLHDMPKSKNFQVNEGATFVYYRFHGPTGNYRGDYTTEFLREHSVNIKNFLDHGKDVYVYFNNTMGNAYENARRLRIMVEKSP